MNWLNKRINLALNLAIVLVVILIGIVFTKTYLLHSHSTVESKDYRIAADTKVSLPGIDWAQNGETLLLVLQKGCHFCKESAPFYQRLAHDPVTIRIVRLVAVLPQEVADSKQYLNDLNVPIGDVRQAGLEALGVQGTPTLILVNSKGKVLESWAGKLPPEKETEIFRRIGENDH